MYQLNNGFFVTHSNLNLRQVDNTMLTYQPTDAIASNSKMVIIFLLKKVKDVKTTIIYTQIANRRD
ncbi:hypothetical protein [Nostoc sp.]|uniref:hypothetical protein n=1 Tax=Nostoc sp. TaxID=1180 RepID=UPI002FF859AE